VGANAVVLNNVADHATVVGIPARSASKRATARDEGFAAYGIPYGEVPDPISRAIEGLLDKVQTLSVRVEELERELAERPAAHPLLDDAETELNDDAPSGPGGKT
jgi:serine O-acetyltransferase